MQSKEKDNLVFVRLFHDEDVFSELKKVCMGHNVVTAVVLNGIGRMKQFELGYFISKGNYASEQFAEAYELVSLAGNLSKQESGYVFHLHAILSDIDKKTVAGHLTRGKVDVTNEIVLLKTGMTIVRKAEPSGLTGLFLEEDK